MSKLDRHTHNRLPATRRLALLCLVGVVGWASTVGCAFRAEHRQIGKKPSAWTVSQTLFVKSHLQSLSQALNSYSADIHIGPVQSSGDSDSLDAAGAAAGSVIGEAVKAGVGL